MSVRDSSTTSLAARRTSVKSRHFGIGAGFVDKDEALRVKIDLPFEPLLTRGIYIAAPLLGGVRCLFLSVIFLRWKKRQSEAMPADIPRRFNNSCNSASVISVFTVTASKINCECASIRCDLRSPPGRLGTTSPASLRRLRQRIALAALIPKRSAARRQDKPSSIAATTLWRRSTESALVMHADLPRQHPAWIWLAPFWESQPIHSGRKML